MNELDKDYFLHESSYIDKNVSIRKTDLTGYCLVWCIWFASLRLKYPDSDLKILVKNAKNILKKKYTYKNFIRNYARDIYIKNNKLLKNNNILININNYSTLNKIDNKNKNKIKKLVEKHFTIYK